MLLPVRLCRPGVAVCECLLGVTFSFLKPDAGFYFISSIITFRHSGDK